MARVDLGRLRPLVEGRYLSVERHPEAHLYIWNYTPKTQFDRYWTDETRMCRGLITTADGTVVARPFAKFFGIDELPSIGLALPPEPFDVYEKLDGSLGIVYSVDGEPRVATRGSFTGVQAQRGTAILRALYGHVRFRTDVTYLVEILYPENRIVVDYGGREDLVLLAAIDTESGVDLPLSEFEGLGLPAARRYDGVADLADLLMLGGENQEGFVVRFRSGLRVKVKLPEYVRLHRLLTGVTPRFLWEQLRGGCGLEELLRGVPEEFGAWVRQTAGEIQAAYDAIEAECRADFAGAPDGDDRRVAAEYFRARRYPAVLFRMLDGKPYEDVIWKLVKPAASRPFRSDDS
jgi:RNA ligase